MKIDTIKQVYLIGIGGIGMSGLARYFAHLGCLVKGYDRTETELTKTLAAEGIDISYQDDIATIDPIFSLANEETLIIFTPAVPKDLKIKHYLERVGHTLYKRSQVLGIISESRFTIGVAGTHGKTTTSTMVAHILKDSGYDCSAFLGGISSNYDTNVLYGKNEVVVVEADEYDRSFLTLHPNIAIVTSADADHLDIYGDASHLLASFQLYLDRVVENGTRIVKKGLPFDGQISYSGHNVADVYADHVHVREGEFYFDYVSATGKIEDIHLGIPGTHNVENAVAAITVARILGIADDKIKAALTNFRGVKRRFEYIVRSKSSIYIDDYAHHPEELRAFLSSMRKLYPNKKLTVVFQPHLFTRTRDFIDGFAEVLSMADRLLLMEIYPARELPIEGVDSTWLLSKITASEKAIVTPEEVLAIAKMEKPELLVTVGAGDIDKLVKPLKEILGNA
ncbi:UDP-N-acetylmuramate--L-alanine ligase [Sphingobacterium sp. SRCM116780]|uniref:UDP-N-acetylmuramate--L-alanine ligase n=1 Tax=Sphingobacterium sp. SRCM116780 TaxID=2907623 RepID=UPI001F400DED|nr:UDP-N-acetylmuramate--L-alanine ligase [Sphingobacterium sp. SRCM116780]UIR56477.1 UDP-N-acetylmuramate--L-alanine ligase [Sphingobacterium sp. SRCM116780]